MSSAWDAIGKFKPVIGTVPLDVGSSHDFALGAEWHAFVLRLAKEKGAFTETIHRANGLRLLDLAEKHHRGASLSVKDGLWLYIEVAPEGKDSSSDNSYFRSHPEPVPPLEKPTKRRTA